MKKILYNKNGSILLWGIPIMLGLILAAIVFLVKGKIYDNSIGKPASIKAEGYGRVESVLIKPGDIIQPGTDIVNYTVLKPESKAVAEEKSENTDITVLEVSGETFVDSVELPGIVDPYIECEVSSQVGGKIVSLLLTEGSHVKKGDLLAQVEKNDYEIALSQAEAAYDLAKAQYERIKTLITANATSTADKDSAEAAYKNALSNLERAKLSLKRCDILSPIDGIVDLKFIEAGEIINSGAKIAKIIDISRVKLNIGIPEQDVNYVRKLKEVKFTVPALNDREFTGIVDHISFSASPVAKVYPMVVHAQNSDEALIPGMVAKAQVVRKVYKDTVILPLFMVIPGDNEYYTFVYEDGKARKRILQLGTFQQKSVHIIHGLKPGDKVIDKGLRLVADGLAVRLVR